MAETVHIKITVARGGAARSVGKKKKKAAPRPAGERHTLESAYEAAKKSAPISRGYAS